MRRRRTALALLVLAFTVGDLPRARAAAGQGQPGDRRPRVTIVGVDGASWRVLDPLIARGELPSLARLVQEGTRGSLRSRIPLWSPAVWTTIATGVRRERHGITGFLDGDGRLVATTHRRSPTLWTLASGAGLRVALIGWWVTYPAEAIRGAVVSERALKSRDTDLRAMTDGGSVAPQGRHLFHPPEVAAQLSDLLAALPERPVETGVREAIIPRMRAEDTTVVRLLQRLRDRTGAFDLEMILLRGTDSVSHYFWNFYEPQAPVYADRPPPPAEERRRYGTAVEDHYRLVDGLLGELSRAEDADVLLVLSDHGFEAGIDGELTGAHHTRAALDGVLIARGAPFRAHHVLEGATIVDVAPTILHVLGLPLAQDLDGHVLTDALDPAWLAAHPIVAVPTYAGPPVLLDPATREQATESPADAPMREQLRALGYIE